MKKIYRILSGLLLAGLFTFTACKPEVKKNEITYAIKINGSSLAESSNEFVKIDLSDFAGKTVEVDLSTTMCVENSGDSANLMWQINTGNSKYPIIASKTFENGTTAYTSVSGSKTGDNAIELGSNPYFYLSTYNLTPANLVIYLKFFSLVITPADEDAVSYKVSDLTGDENAITTGTITDSTTWLDVASLKETFVDGGYFDRFGLACEVSELGVKTTAEGLLYHANTTTPGNELKPQFIFWQYSSPSHTATFTASNGKTIYVPDTINFSIKMDPYLEAAKAAGIQIRGHVLTWHSQTPDWFFTEDYAYDVTTDSDGNPTNLVDEETMTARHEWYIKSVLEHVAEWEAANGYGEGNHLIYSWDVVNEAVADDAQDSDTNYLRGSTTNTKGGSRWYQIYEDEEFIINAFRFANAYAPSDVTLCYNDYNEYLNYSGENNAGAWKTKGIVRLLNAVKNGEAQTVNGKSTEPRIDAMGMQSHVEPSWMSVSSYEGALKTFLALDLDVQVTEFDIATTIEDDTDNWEAYFNMFLKYSKKGSEISKYNGHHITGFTIWGINDENSWISKNGTQYPLLFTKSGSSYIPKECFYSVVNSVK
jgi:endo-1,4-beta-xylanase